MACDGDSLNIAPDDLVMSENVEVVWWLGEIIHIVGKYNYKKQYFCIIKCLPRVRQ